MRFDKDGNPVLQGVSDLFTAIEAVEQTGMTLADDDPDSTASADRSELYLLLTPHKTAIIHSLLSVEAIGMALRQDPPRSSIHTYRSVAATSHRLQQAEVVVPLKHRSHLVKALGGFVKLELDGGTSDSQLHAQRMLDEDAAVPVAS